MSALSERRGVECRKFRETFEGNNINGNPELSLVENEESAESRHGKPKSKKPRKLNAIRKWCKLYGIWIWLRGTPDHKHQCKMVVNNYSGKKLLWPVGCAGSSPASSTILRGRVKVTCRSHKPKIVVRVHSSQQ